jgi:N-acetylmuramic acid 6-phosphate (MurNAc-6-P) etherase
MISKGIEKKNIVIDLTGGKTPFSLAAFNSAKRNGINAVYTDSEYELNKPKSGTQKSILLVKALDD